MNEWTKDEAVEAVGWMIYGRMRANDEAVKRGLPEKDPFKDCWPILKTFLKEENGACDVSEAAEVYRLATRQAIDRRVADALETHGRGMEAAR